MWPLIKWEIPDYESREKFHATQIDDPDLRLSWLLRVATGDAKRMAARHNPNAARRLTEELIGWHNQLLPDASRVDADKWSGKVCEITDGVWWPSAKLNRDFKGKKHQLNSDFQSMASTELLSQVNTDAPTDAAQ